MQRVDSLEKTLMLGGIGGRRRRGRQRMGWCSTNEELMPVRAGFNLATKQHFFYSFLDVTAFMCAVSHMIKRIFRNILW